MDPNPDCTEEHPLGVLQQGMTFSFPNCDILELLPFTATNIPTSSTDGSVTIDINTAKVSISYVNGILTPPASIVMDAGTTTFAVTSPTTATLTYKDIYNFTFTYKLTFVFSVTNNLANVTLTAEAVQDNELVTSSPLPGVDGDCPAVPIDCCVPTLCITAYVDNQIYQDVSYASFNVGDCREYDTCDGFGDYRGFIQKDGERNTIFYVTLLDIGKVIIGSGTYTQKTNLLRLGSDFLVYVLLKFILWRLVFGCFTLESLYRDNYKKLIDKVSRSIYRNALPTLLEGQRFERYLRYSCSDL